MLHSGRSALSPRKPEWDLDEKHALLPEGKAAHGDTAQQKLVNSREAARGLPVPKYVTEQDCTFTRVGQ
jgi:hypothetical protein